MRDDSVRGPRGVRRRQPLGRRGLRLVVERAAEAAAQRRCESAVVPCPNLSRSSRARLFCHAQDFIALLEIKRKSHRVPALLERLPVFRVRGVFEDLNTGHILSQKAQPK